MNTNSGVPSGRTTRATRWLSAERVRAMIGQRCPVCFEGPMYRGLLRMNESCPVCGHTFEREPGFFQGAMYVSYLLASATFAVFALLAQFWLAPRIGEAAAFAVAIALQLPLVPQLWRYSRVVWAHVNIGTRQ